jgi:hypothetical protein
MFGRRESRPSASEPGQPFAGKRFVCRHLVTTHLDSPSRIAHPSGTTGVGEVPNELLALAEMLQSWATFDEHLASMESAGLTLTGGDLANALGRLEQAGALWLADDFLRELGGQACRPPAPIGSMVWCTRDRPETLVRSLESFLGNPADSAVPRVIVCDDTIDPEVAQATGAALRSCAERHAIAPGNAIHVGMDEKRHMIASLKELGARRGVSPEVVEFILCNGFQLPFSEGANRNFALLLTTGDAFVSTDDDTLAQAAPGSDPGTLELTSASLPNAIDLSETDELCAAGVPVRERGVRAEHGKFLGRGIADILREFGGSEIILPSCTSSFALELTAGEAAVAVTSAGVVGDSGFGNPRICFQLDGAERERYVEDPEAYAMHRLSRFAFRRAERPTVTSSPWLMALNYAVDNRGSIPPTFPFGRNSDGLLGVLVRACRPSGYIMHLPFGIRHIPPSPRSFSESDLHDFVPRICDFMIYAVDSARLNPIVRVPADRSAALASHYRALGGLSARAFDDASRAVWMTFAERYVSSMEMRLNQYGHSPDAWADDVERHIDRILDFIRDPLPRVPSEIAAALGPSASASDQLELFRKSVRLFGEALDAWPTLREIVTQHPLI